MSSAIPAYPPFHHRHPRFWRRVRLYIAALLLACALVVYGIVSYIRNQPESAFRKLVSNLPFPHRVSSVRWKDSNTLVVENLAFGQPGNEFFHTQTMVIRFTWKGLASQQLDLVEMTAPQLFLGRLNAQMRTDQSGSFSSGGLAWSIRHVELKRGTIWLENLGAQEHLIPIRVGVRRPVELNNIRLNDPGYGDAADELQTAEIDNVILLSPLDPLSPVISFPLTRVQFTYGDLWQHKVRSVQFIQPVIYLGSDLFWFTDEFSQNHPVNENSETVDAPWIIQHFEVNYGQLAVSAFGQVPLQFPFYFETRAENVRLDQLDRMTMQNTLRINRFDREYPEYKLKIVNLNGTLAFNVPPSVDTAENIVQTLDVGEVAINGITAKKLTSTLIFDRTGIFGNIQGTCYGGIMKGDFGVSYGAGFPWAANFQVDKVDVAPVSEKLAPSYFKLTGKLIGDINIRGSSMSVKKCEGKLRLPQPGVLYFDSLKSLLGELNHEPPSLKKAISQKMVESLQVYPYDSGLLTLDYANTGGTADLKLLGSRGDRDFTIVWHPAKTSGN